MNPASRDQVQHLTPEQENDALALATAALITWIARGSGNAGYHDWRTNIERLTIELEAAMIPVQRRGIVGFEKDRK